MNAISAPGGFVFVSSGFIDALRDEDELAAVLAHEIAHVANQDGVKAISNANLFSALSEASTQGASVALNNVSSPIDVSLITATFSQSVDGVMEKLLTKGFDRSQEYQADLYAAKLLQRAGYDPSALVRVLTILKDRSSGSREGWYATHPSPTDRIEEVESEFKFPDDRPQAPVRVARFNQVFP
jgi:predicted Zn-dependent protease